MNSLPVGKLPTDILAKMLKTYTFFDERVKVGPSTGEEAAAITKIFDRC
ncbi:MAG TPA: hypothetical protein VEJ88_04635 [Dissulfurispiraceae bacterium]|nr:hypothetical protein [Dissulfurispiraceae bacterium]